MTQIGENTKLNPVLIGLIPIAFILGIATGYATWGVPAPSAALAPTATVMYLAPALPQPDAPALAEAHDPAIGPASAPVTVVEFGDYQCGYCKQFHDLTFAGLMAAYPEQVRFVYRDFPLAEMHPEATPAANAAQCAGEQGRYWEFHNALYETQAELGSTLYGWIAERLELDVAAFGECVESGSQFAEVQADYEAGMQLGVNGTPTFFVNGTPLVGSVPLSDFQQAIDLALANAGALP
jgi:protein-disulfide isomerase